MTFQGDLQFDRYEAGKSQEFLLLIGAAGGTPILFLPPLFEEMNRTRALIVAMIRILAGHGFSCWLPDLPGTGESERALEDCTWQDWRNAAKAAADHVAARAGKPPAIASLRGGCLLDDAAGGACHWRFAPAEGASLVRDLERSSLIGAKEQVGDVLDFAGYRMMSALVEALRQAGAGQQNRLRTVRLASDRGEADHKVDGPALWRRSEPGRSDELAQILAADLRSWCA